MLVKNDVCDDCELEGYPTILANTGKACVMYNFQQDDWSRPNNRPAYLFNSLLRSTITVIVPATLPLIETRWTGDNLMTMSISSRHNPRSGVYLQGAGPPNVVFDRQSKKVTLVDFEGHGQCTAYHMRTLDVPELIDISSESGLLDIVGD